MKKKLQIISLLIIGLFTFNNIKEVNAASVSSSLALSKNTVNPGDTFTLSINVSGLTNGMASADYTISYDSSKFTYVSYSMGQSKPSGDIILNNTSGKVLISYVDSQFGANPISNGTLVNLTFKANSSVTSGTSTFSLSGGGYSDKDANSLSGTCSGATINTYVPSTDSNLSSLLINNGTLSPSFNPNTLSYSATVDAASVTISATAPSKGSVSGTGTKTLNYGTNTFQIIAKSESGNTKTYTITITRPDNRSTNNYLKTLTITNIKTTFNKDTLNYNYNVENSVNEVEISATVEDNKSKISGTGKKTLNVGANTFKVVVTSEKGTTRTYTIIINRKDEEGKLEELASNTNLKKFIINNINWNVKDNVYKYSVNVENNIDNVNISYELEDSKATATIKGSKNLKVGENKFEIVVTAQNGESKTYEIIINRKSKTETTENENSKPETVEKDNPKTGIDFVYPIISFVIIISVTGIILCKKKAKFGKI